MRSSDVTTFSLSTQPIFLTASLSWVQREVPTRQTKLLEDAQFTFLTDSLVSGNTGGFSIKSKFLKLDGRTSMQKPRNLFKFYITTRMSSLYKESRNFKASNGLKVKRCCFLHTNHPIIDIALPWIVCHNRELPLWVLGFFSVPTHHQGWYRRSRAVRRRYAAARLLGFRVQIPPEAWMSASCECCVLWGRGFGDGPIPRPE
jgi:hypothetical protein